MSNTKHTPGPWEIRADNSEELEILAGEGCESFFVARLQKKYWGSSGIVPKVYSQYTDERMRANASLIAAAPDMAEALKNLLAKIDWRPGDPLVQSSKTIVIDIARKALKKAGAL